MAANRIEPAKETAPTAAPTPEAPPPVSPAGGFKAWLPLIVTVIAMPLLAYGVTSFVLLPKLQRGLNIPVGNASGTKASEESTPAAKKDGPKQETVTLNKLLVNAAGTMGARYLLCTLALAGSKADFRERIESHNAQLIDAATGVLMTKTIADIEKPGARNIIKSELMNSFNTVLGGAVVEDIFFTEFAIQ